MAAKKPRAKRVIAPDRAMIALLPSPRTPALVTRAAFGAALVLLGCRDTNRSPPPMNPPQREAESQTAPATTAVTEEGVEALADRDAGAFDATVVDAAPDAAKPRATPSATVTATAPPPMRPPPPMVRPPPMVNQPPMVRPPMVRPPIPPHPAPSDDPSR